MFELDDETRTGFLNEVNGYLPVIRAGLAAFRAAPADGETLGEVYRCVHIVKGASAMVGLSDLSHIAHHLEEIAERALHEPHTLAPDRLDQFEEGVRFLELYFAGLAEGDIAQTALVGAALRHVRRLAGLPGDEMPPAARAPADLPLPEFAPDELIPSDPDWLTPAPWHTPAPAFEPEPAPVSTSSGGREVSPELMEVFRLEADDHLRTLTALLPEARNDPADKDRWQMIRRATHTLKGCAGLVGFDDVTRLAHRMEDLLDLYYDGARAATPDEVDLLLAGADAIEDAVAGRDQRAVFAGLHTRLAALLAAHAPEPVPEEAPEPVAVPARAPEPAPAAPAAPARSARELAESTVRVPIERLDEVTKLLGELVIARTALEQRAGEFARLIGEARPAGERLKRVSGRIEVGYEASALAGARGDRTGAPADGFDDLELDRYTEFHLLSRELAETATDVQTVVGEFGHLHGDFDGQLTRFARLTSELEDKLMRLRMVPLSVVASKLHRTVRNAAEAAKKRAELVLEGERTGLDKTVLEAMADPLLHLLRNAVDHGLESTEVRLALGKPAHGTVTLRARHEGSYVVLALSDDGRGIDFEQVRATAVRRQLVSPGAAAALTRDELAEFLFLPGFSTRAAVSELSGRGVGLDVVKTKVEALKGTVEVTAAPGCGTTFTIRLPMTLGVVRALLVRAAGQTFALPLEAVELILRPGPEDIDRVGRERVLRVDGSVCPLVPLAHVLRLRGAPDGDTARPLVVVLRSGGRRVALEIDQLLGGREVVTKSLGRRLKHLPAVSGATLMGDGSVVLILNPADLTRGATNTAARSVERAPITPTRQTDGLTVLVVDDSPSVRRVVTMLIKGAGWNAVTAKDGFEALELLEGAGAPPDVILSDVEMPRMDGYELLGAVRGRPRLCHIPVAMLTSRAAEKHRRRALDLGASAYVVKPYQDENLLDILRHLARAARPVGAP